MGEPLRHRLLQWWARPVTRTALLALAVVAITAAYLLTDVPGSLSYALQVRTRTVAAVVVVAAAIGVSSVVFHTVTANRILTPSILGFDAVYALIATTAVFVFGSAALGADRLELWLAQVGLMVLASTALFSWLFGGRRRSLHLLLLVGIVLGVALRSLAEWMQRMMDPLDFEVLTDALFASITRPDTQLLWLSAALVATGCAALFPLRHVLDVLTLGPAAATGLGVDHRRTVLVLLAVVSVLVAASTALVGPVLFLGLLVANLSYAWSASARHAWTLPNAVLMGAGFLLGAQLVLERVLGYSGTLSVLVEFTGGLFFLYLVLRKAAR